MLQENDALPLATEPLSKHLMRRTTRQTMYFGYKLGELTENNKALLFLSGKDTIQSFNGSIKAVTLLFAKRLTSELPYLQILQRSNFRLI